MKSNPAVPGGSLMSEPTWSNTFGYSAASAFFVFGVAGQPLGKGVTIMGGKTDVVKGRIKEAAGALTNNNRLRAKGKADQAVGKAKQAVQKTVDTVKKAVKKAIR